MKKFIILLIVITILSIMGDYNSKKTIIPKESIRFRVIANSNTKEDQQLKMKVKENLEKDINKTLINKNTLELSRTAIKNNMLLFEKNIRKTLSDEKSNQTFNINYGQNYFPEKNYNNVVYNAGDYESLVITLGKGEGENFWCVLFPPLCMLEADENNTKDVKYHILVKDIIDKYTKHSK